MIQDPAQELIDLVRRSGESASEVDRRAAALIRRRFDLALPVPLVDPPAAGEEIPIRPATAFDGPAIAAMKWRSWRVAYRGLVPDEFLDRLEINPPVAYWIGVGTLAPSRRHRVLVAGRQGTVLGMVDLRPTRDDDLDQETVSEIVMLYLEPTLRRRALGRRLMDAAVAEAQASGISDLRLWVVEGNRSARAFYEAQGWEPDGSAKTFDLGDGLGLAEVRYRLAQGQQPTR